MRAFLGEAEDGPTLQTPLGINYQARGFDRIRTKKINKSIAWMTKHGYTEYAIREFETYVRLLGSPGHIPAAIDRAFEVIKSKWLARGGLPATVAQTVKPDSILILIEPLPVWIPEKSKFANGCALSDKRTIRAVCVYFNFMNTPEKAELVKFDDIVRWECGNIYCKRGGYPELGDQVPG